MPSKQKLRRLIADGDTRSTLENLKKLTEDLPDSTWKSEALHQAGRYANYQKENNLGKVSKTDADQTLAQINWALLDLIERMPEAQAHSVHRMKWVKMGSLLSLLLLLSVLGGLYFSSRMGSLTSPNKQQKKIEPSVHTSGDKSPAIHAPHGDVEVNYSESVQPSKPPISKDSSSSK